MMFYIFVLRSRYKYMEVVDISILKTNQDKWILI